MDHWAYNLGCIFGMSNIIHKQFFRTRGGNPPQEMIGSYFVKIALRNPAKAFKPFYQKFHLYSVWAAKYLSEPVKKSDKSNFWNVKRSMDEYKRALAALPTELPNTMTSADTLLFVQGFYNKLAYQQKELEQTENEPVVV